MADHDELLSQFKDVTGANAERSKFYLESSGWNLEIAMASFYETDGDDVGLDVEVQDESVPVEGPAVDSSPEEAATPKPKAKPQKPKTNSKFATISSLANETGSSDEEEGQAFYAGGSEHSGQQVLGPKKNKANFVSEMFKSVKEHGAEVVDQSPSRPNTFAGTGYRLGQSSNDTEVIASPSEGPQERRHSEVTLRFWKDGFSVDNGPLREYSNPENAEFLGYVRRGLVPMELVQQARGGEVHLNMEDHHHEDYTTPKTRVKAFAGKGHLLGSPAPATVGSTPVGASASQSQLGAGVGLEEAEEAARKGAEVDQSAPTTTIQIRLADGSRLVAKFNQSHTIADIRRYIITARPQYEQNTFSLLTSFPSKELTDESQTLVEAGVLNSALLQRLK